MRQSWNFRRYPRGRPHCLQRLTLRDLNFGFRSALTIIEIFAMCSSWLLREGQTELAEEETSLVVVLRIGDDGDVHPLGLVDLGDVDLGEDEVVANAERVVAASVERFRWHAAEVAHARQGGGDQAVEELVHLLAAQGDHRADGLSFAQLEAGDRFLGLGDDRLLSGDLSQLVDGAVEDLGVRDRFAHPHVEDDFLDLGNSHRVLDPELVLDLLSDFSLVELFESWCHGFLLAGVYGLFSWVWGVGSGVWELKPLLRCLCSHPPLPKTPSPIHYISVLHFLQ